jgi:hypothetical protein
MQIDAVAFQEGINGPTVWQSTIIDAPLEAKPGISSDGGSNVLDGQDGGSGQKFHDVRSFDETRKKEKWHSTSAVYSEETAW